MFLQTNLQNHLKIKKEQPVETLQKYMSHVKLPINDKIFEEVSKQLDIIPLGKRCRDQPRLEKGTQFRNIAFTAKCGNPSVDLFEIHLLGAVCCGFNVN